MKLETEEFFNDMNNTFKEILEEKKRTISIINKETEKELDIDYSKVLFDSDLNIYKIDKTTGVPVLAKKDSGFIAKINL